MTARDLGEQPMLELPRVSQEEANILLPYSLAKLEQLELKFCTLVVSLQGNCVCVCSHM